MFFSNIKLENIQDHIKVSGFPINQFRVDLKKKWGSNKLLEIYNIAFSWYSYSSGFLKFHKFFVPELIYILSQLPKRKAYIELAKQLQEKTWFIQTTKDFPSRCNLNKLSVFNVQLLPWQKKFIEVYDQRRQQFNLRGYLNASSAGSAKTLTSIALMECLDKDKIIVVAPNNTIHATWENEIQKWHKEKQLVWTKVNPIKDAKWYVVNYESMNIIVDMLTNGEIKGSNIGFIIDEVHNFRNKETLRSQNAFRIVELTKTQDVIALSGTPTKAMSVELIPLMKVLDPLFTDEIEDIFKKAFGKASTQLSDIVAHRLGLMMYRVIKEDVMTLPPKNEETIRVKVPDSDKYTLEYLAKEIKKFINERSSYYAKYKKDYEYDYNEALKYFEKYGKFDKEGYKEYKELVKKIIENKFNTYEEKSIAMKQANLYEKNVIIPVLPNDLKKKFRKAKSVVKYVNLVIVGEVLGNILPKARANCYRDIVEHGPVLELVKHADKKAILFTTYGAVVEHSLELFKKKGYHPVGIYQKTSNLRDKYIKEFKENSSINPMITTVQMMATGVTLNEANISIFAPTPFRYTDYEQAYSRHYRLGQDSEVFIYTLVLDTGGKPNISTRIEDISKWSEELFKSIVGSKIDKIDLEEELQNASTGEECFIIQEEDKEQWLSAFEVF